MGFIRAEAAWNSEEYDNAMKTAGVYVSCANLFWINIRQLTSPTVPINSAALDKISKAFFQQGPEKLSLEVVVGVGSAVTAERFIQLHGNLNRISPEEVDHALLIHIAGRIKEGATEDELVPLGPN